jgi:hypothetical protein
LGGLAINGRVANASDWLPLLLLRLAGQRDRVRACACACACACRSRAGGSCGAPGADPGPTCARRVCRVRAAK